MSRKSTLTSDQIQTLRTARDSGESFRAAGKLVGVSPSTVMRALGRTRDAEEFRGAVAVRAPRRDRGAYAWSLETIRAARDSQMMGDFKLPVRLAEALRTDDALFSAYHNRIAPHDAIRTRLVPASGTRGATVARKASASVQISRSVLKGILGTLVNHALAIGYNEHTPSDDGTRVDFKHVQWPLEHVRWNASTEMLETRTRDGVTVPIVHGDGRWVVYRKFIDLPWTQDACLLPAALLWAAHAGGIKDWAQASTAHGGAKVVGKLPEGVPTHKSADVLSDEADAFLNMLQGIVSGDEPAGLIPFGADADFIANGSNAWQVFSELISNREKAAARIYLGTDAMLGSVGGAPGVDIATLFGVATTKTQGDFEAIEQGANTGIYDPWTAINCGDSTYAPGLEYLLPDPDEEKQSADNATKRNRLFDAIKRMREEQMNVDQVVVDELAAAFGVHPAPRLVEAKTKAVPLTLAPTDGARVIKVNEARRSMGLPDLTDKRGELFISELENFAEAKADIAVDAAAPTPEPAPA